MNNTEHYTLEQVRERVKAFRMASRNYQYSMSDASIYDLINEAINQRIGDPDAYTWKEPTKRGGGIEKLIGFDTPCYIPTSALTCLYALKEIKP